MDCIERIENLIAHLPRIAREEKTVEGFWRRIEDYMSEIRNVARSDDEHRELDLRFGDLVDMANDLGMVRSDDD